MSLRRPLEEARRLDLIAYEAIARSPNTPFDRALSRLSTAANYSRLSISAAAALAIGCGPAGRRAAVRGLSSVAVTSAFVNGVLKPAMNRRRPDRGASEVPVTRHVGMPASTSFPSGHSAAAFAFAAGAGRALPRAAPPLTALAVLVAYSRVHTGVHYPGDVIAGALCGVALAAATERALDRLGA